MYQQFALTVFANVFAGLALANCFFKERIRSYAEVAHLFDLKCVRFTAGVMALIAGVLSLFSSYPMAVPLLGNLLPALFGMTMGLSLVVESYPWGKEEKSSLPTKVHAFLERYRTLLGILGILVGIVHFFSPISTILI